MLNAYGKTTAGDKLIFYNVKTNTNILTDAWMELLGSLILFILVISLIFGYEENRLGWMPNIRTYTAQEWGKVILFIAFSCIFMYLLLVESLIKTRYFTFTLTADAEEISLNTRSKQWAYKIADIAKIVDISDGDNMVCNPIFIIAGKEVHVFQSMFLFHYNLKKMIEDIALHSGIKLEKRYNRRPAWVGDWIYEK